MNEKININIDFSNKKWGFDSVIVFLEKGASAKRFGWNGKDLLVKLQVPDENSKMTLPYFYIEYPNGDKCPWHASQTDILAKDWEIIK